MDLKSILERLDRPRRALVTAGMPYANGPLHIGHLAGAQLPADIHARWLGLLIGRENVLYVCGTDDHGATSELAAMQSGKPVAEAIAEIHAGQKRSMERFSIGLDIYSGTSHPETFPRHAERCQAVFRKIYENGLLTKKTTAQWYDPKVDRFLPDRLVSGCCPKPKCDNENAYSDECDVCGAQYDPTELVSPRSAVSDATPELRDTAHLWLDMWATSERVKAWIETKRKTWRPVVIQQVLENLKPSLRFEREHEEAFKTFSSELPGHKRKYAPGQQVLVQFETKADLATGQAAMAERGIDTEVVDEWAYRSISRDIPWGIPMPELDPEIVNKTLYVWPDSLLAPIAFAEAALEARGDDPADVRDYWYDPDARAYQFLGQDNVFFYVLMQAAMWLGSQDDPQQLPGPGDLQLSEIFGCFHLLVGGAKMSKSRGNKYTPDELIDDMGYTADQVRYYLALLGLSEKPGDFDFEKFNERNVFLTSKMNAAFERPISAAHSKFGGIVPEGDLIDGVEKDTQRMVMRYVRSMEKANYPNMLYELENYARKINTLFNKYKPHDDRHDEEMRRHALYSAFYVLKSLMIMLQPFVPETMERLRQSLNLPADVFRVDELGTPIPAGHVIGAQLEYFPQAEAAEDSKATDET